MPNHPCLLFFWSALAVAGVSYPVVADIILDGSLGRPGGAISTNPTGEYTIRADMGKQVGTNLFHSFGQFSIKAGETANFTDGGVIGPVHNILSRVTGGNPSNIDGILKTSFANDQPNFFFMNPAGVIFGPNANLDVQGSFHVTTADYLRLGDGVRFNAMPSGSDALLSVAPVERFGFLGERLPGKITIEKSMLNVLEEKDFSLIGGRINIVGSHENLKPSIGAADGRINIASVASNGEAIIKDRSLDIKSFNSLENIDISDEGWVSTSGKGGGAIFIRSGQLIMKNSYITAETLGNKNGIGIDIKSNNILIYGTDLTGQNHTGLFSDTNSSGNAGDINIKANNIDVRDGAWIDAGTSGEGNGGNVSIFTDNISLFAQKYSDFTGIFSVSESSNSGNSGNITISTNYLTMYGTVQISPSSKSTIGHGGNLTINAKNDINIQDIPDDDIQTGLFSTSDALGVGGNLFVNASGSIKIDGYDARILTRTLGKSNAGLLTVRAKNLTISNGAEIYGGIGNGALDPPGDPDGEGNGGNIDVKVDDNLQIYGNGSISSVAQVGHGKAGDVSVQAGNIEIKDGGEISASTFSSGDGGAVNVKSSNNIIISGPNSDTNQTGIFSVTNKSGIGGNVTVSAKDSITMDGGGARVLARTLGVASAGILKIKSKNLEIANGAQIYAGIGNSALDIPGDSNGSGNGGSIYISVDDILSIYGIGLDGGLSSISSQAQIGYGNGGNLFLTAKTLDVRNGGWIESTTLDHGNAGNIEIQTDYLSLAGNNASINASTFGSGNGGNINIINNILSLRDGSTIAAKSRNNDNNSGVSGNIFIDTNHTIQLFNGSQISVETQRANAGDIRIYNAKFLQLNDNSSISTSAAVINNKGTGNGGNIFINPTFTILGNNSKIIAKAKQGNGGKIDINSNYLFRSPDSVIDASSESGKSGTITIKSPDSNITNGILKLPTAILTTKMDERCANRASEIGKSSFKQGHRKELYAIPGITHLRLSAKESTIKTQAKPPQRISTSHSNPDYLLNPSQLTINPYSFGCQL